MAHTITGAAIFTFRGANTLLELHDLRDEAFAVDLVYIANLSNQSADCFPAIVKPAWEGSSKGIRGKCVVDTPQELVAVIEAQRRDYRQSIMAEEYVQGDELTVGVIGNESPRVPFTRNQWLRVRSQKT